MRHFVYDQVKRIHDPSTGRASRMVYRLDIVVLCIYIIRMLYSLVVRMDVLREHELWKYEYLSNFYMRNLRMYDAPFVMSQQLMFALGIYTIAQYYFRENPKFWSFFYELVVANTDQYRASEKSPREIELLLNTRMRNLIRNSSVTYMQFPFFYLFHYAKMKMQIWLNLEHIDVKLFTQQSLPSLREASLSHRIRILLFIAVCELIILGTHLVFSKSLSTFPLSLFTWLFAVCFAILFLKIYYPLFTQDYHHLRWYMVVIVFDMLLIAIESITIIQVVELFIGLTLLWTLVCVTQLTHLNRQLAASVASSGRWYLRRSNALSKQMRHFLAQHTRLCTRICHFNSSIGSQVLFAFGATNIPINIYLVSKLIIDRPSLFESTSFVGIILAQFAVSIIFGVPLANVHSQVHRCSEFLPKAQYAIRKCDIHLKIKYDALMSRVTTGRNYGLALGPFEELTRGLLVKVTCVVFQLNSSQVLF